MLTLTIKTHNAAFEGDARNSELAAILRNLAHRVENADSSEEIDWNVFDSNGNRVGRLYVEESDNDKDS